MDNNEKNHNYSVYFSISFTVILIGIIIDYISYPTIIEMPQYPVNLYIIGVFVLTTSVFYYILDKRHIVSSKLYSMQSALASVSAFTVLVLLMGFIPQEDNSNALITKIGLTHITSSWAYTLVSFHFLIVLTFTIYKRLTFSLKLRNIAFFINHAGLWIVIVTASFGAGDLKRLYVYVKEGETTNIAYNHKSKQEKIPFRIKLKDFIMEEYPPQVGIFDMKTGYLITLRNENNPKTVKEKLTMKIDSWTLEVDKFLSSSQKINDTFEQSNFFGSYPAAKIKITKNKMKMSRYQWITPGNSWTPTQNITLSNKYIVSLLKPTAKKYSSKVSIQLPDNKIYKGNIEVNKPYKYKDWKIYQTGYDDKMGKYSQLSILEVVYDPWLPYVYVGIFMLITGSIYFVFYGKHGVHK